MKASVLAFVMCVMAVVNIASAGIRGQGPHAERGKTHGKSQCHSGDNQRVSARKKAAAKTFLFNQPDEFNLTETVRPFEFKPRSHKLGHHTKSHLTSWKQTTNRNLSSLSCKLTLGQLPVCEISSCLTTRVSPAEDLPVPISCSYQPDTGVQSRLCSLAGFYPLPRTTKRLPSR